METRHLTYCHEHIFQRSIQFWMFARSCLQAWKILILYLQKLNDKKKEEGILLAVQKTALVVLTGRHFLTHK